MKLWKNLEFVDVGEHIDVNGRTFGTMPLIRDLLEKEKGYLAEYTEEGYLKATATLGKDCADFLEKLGGRLLYRLIGDTGDTTMYLWPDGIADLSVSGSYITIRVMSHNEEMVRQVKDHFDGQWMPPEKKGHIYAIVQNGSHLGLSSIGNAGIPAVSENYTPQVIEDYREAIVDLQSESPSGRIVIMSGTPGTGKTHLIRAMLLEVPDAMFVLISPEMVTNIAGPQLLPLLMNYRGGTKGPIVLVLEDADKCLVQRGKDNMSSIQSLLNLGDGILGSLLDLRIVATTNAQELQMEEALMRPGRLSKHIKVGVLDRGTATGIFKRLCPKKRTLPKVLTEGSDFKMTLAEAYSLARKNGWKPGVRKIEVDKAEDEEDWND